MDAPGTPFEDEIVVRRIRFSSEETGFAVVDADRDGDELVLIGPLAHLEEREHVKISGVWHDDKRYGPQVKVSLAESVPPSGDEALMAYLKRVRHVGAIRASKLLDRYGDHVLDVIDEDPGLAFRRIGLNPQRAREAAKSWNALRSTRALHLLLAPHGLAWLVPRIAAEYGERAHDTVRKRPYELTNVFGVGFQIADTIARAAGVPRDSPGRRRAAVVHVLIEAERDGLHLPAGARAGDQGRGRCWTAPPPDAAAVPGHGRARRPRARAGRRTCCGPTARPRTTLEVELGDARSNGLARPRRRRSSPRSSPRTTSPRRPSRRRRCSPRSRRASRSSPAAPAPARPRRSG